MTVSCCVLGCGCGLVLCCLIYRAPLECPLLCYMLRAAVVGTALSEASLGVCVGLTVGLSVVGYLVRDSAPSEPSAIEGKLEANGLESRGGADCHVLDLMSGNDVHGEWLHPIDPRAVHFVRAYVCQAYDSIVGLT